MENPFRSQVAGKWHFLPLHFSINPVTWENKLNVNKLYLICLQQVPCPHASADLSLPVTFASVPVLQVPSLKKLHKPHQQFVSQPMSFVKIHFWWQWQQQVLFCKQTGAHLLKMCSTQTGTKHSHNKQKKRLFRQLEGKSDQGSAGRHMQHTQEIIFEALHPREQMTLHCRELQDTFFIKPLPTRTGDGVDFLNTQKQT